MRRIEFRRACAVVVVMFGDYKNDTKLNFSVSLCSFFAKQNATTGGSGGILQNRS